MLTNTNYGLDCLETEHMLLGSPQIVWKKGIKKRPVNYHAEGIKLSLQ